jgi:hypothetical protein
MSRALILALCATLAACGGGNVDDECADYSAPLMMAQAPTVGAAAVTLPTSQTAPTIGAHVSVAPAALPAVGDDGACK